MIENFINELVTFEGMVYQLKDTKSRISLMDFDRWIEATEKQHMRVSLLLQLHDNDLLLENLSNKLVKVLTRSLNKGL